MLIIHNIDWKLLGKILQLTKQSEMLLRIYLKLPGIFPTFGRISEMKLLQCTHFIFRDKKEISSSLNL